MLRRWVNGTVEPVAERLRTAAQAYLNRDYFLFASVLDSPVFGLEAAGSDTTLEPALRWLMKGASPGRSNRQATYCDDLVLAAVGIAFTLLCTKADNNERPPTLAHAVNTVGDEIRLTILGQWIGTAQGPAALEATNRRAGLHGRRRKRSLGRIAALYSGQIKEVVERGNYAVFGQSAVLQITDPTTRKERQVTFIPPTDPYDWKLLETLWRPKGETDVHRGLWSSLALLFLCAIQMETGWFDIAEEFTGRWSRARRYRKTRHLVFSDSGWQAISRDMDKWLALGLVYDPMVVPADHGQYLTVKQRTVTGRRGPNGYTTETEGTDHWATCCDVLASTPWEVNQSALQAVQAGPLAELVQQTADPVAYHLTVAEHKRNAGRPLWVPIFLDFRGRAYPRSPYVNYQGNDLRKGLIRFVNRGETHCDDIIPLVLQATNLYGNRLDKAPLAERLDWYARATAMGHDEQWNIVRAADDPVQLWALFNAIRTSRSPDMPVHQDGTCNGLQHLSALFRDAEAAPYVNLQSSTFSDRPADIYQRVADLVLAKVDALKFTQAWAGRLLKGNVQFTRKLFKGPVMVLPYGGTLTTIEDSLRDKILEDGPLAEPWVRCLRMTPSGFAEPDQEAIDAGYLAFADRRLEWHPLFRRDVHELAVLTWQSIHDVIPKAMHAMAAFRSLGRTLRDNALIWDGAFGVNPLKIVHAYPRSESKPLKLRGMHFTGAIRGLMMLAGRDEVDPHKHVTGIVANFIHSCDAAHLAGTMRLFRQAGGREFASIHDSLACRPADYWLLHRAVRQAFVNLYGQPTSDPAWRHPLECPTRLVDVATGLTREFDSWYALFEAAGLELPECGSLDVGQVRDSAWFFS